MSGSSAFKCSFRHFVKKFTPYFEAPGPTIVPQIYSFLSDVIDERVDIFSLTLHLPGRAYELMADMPRSILELPN